MIEVESVVAGQYAAVDDMLTGRENLELIGRLYHIGKQEHRRRTDELLRRLSLSDAGGRLAGTYSGGMRRRLDIAASLAGGTPVVILDEPTAGLGPRTRNALWDVIRERSGQGTSVLLTTQNLEEAGRLANRIVLIKNGCAAADRTPDQLKDLVGSTVLQARAAVPDTKRAAALLADLGQRDRASIRRSSASPSRGSARRRCPQRPGVLRRRAWR
jgi:ABC-2 type transport system ATP-binding protein